jgi:hypothetical protein
MESQNHLRDAVDKKYITEATRLEMDALAEEALREVTGLMEYLQSAEALQNARRAKERRIASRDERRTKAIGGTVNPEPEPQPEPEPEPELEQEPRSENGEA